MDRIGSIEVKGDVAIAYEALSTASDMIKEMTHLDSDTLKFLIKTMDDKLNNRRISLKNR